MQKDHPGGKDKGSDDELNSDDELLMDESADEEEEEVASTSAQVGSENRSVGESDLSEEDEESDDDDDEKIDVDDEKDLASVLGSTKGKELLQVPKDIHCDAPLFDLQFHPNEELIALATLDGTVLIYNYDNEENALKTTLKCHEKPCRSVRFSEKGQHVYSVSKDGSIAVYDVETSNQVHRVSKAHESAIYSMCVLGSNFLATGDDDGAVKVWDLRRQDPICSWNDMFDYITSMVADEDRRTMVCSSGDGTITAYNVKARKKIVQSEDYDQEPTSLAIVKSGSKLAMGTSGKRNPIYFFNWNEFGYHSDTLKGHPSGISCMTAASDRIIVTGDDSGVLRAAHIFPHRFLGVVGRHSGGFGVENLALCPDGSLLASCGGQDQTVCFWNLEYIEGMEKSSFKKRKGKIRLKNLPSSRQQNVADFFADMKEDED